MQTAKEAAEAMLHQLPDDSSFEDIQYHLYVLEKINKGIQRAEQEGTVPQSQAEERLDRWIIK
ncbi:MAG: hypothetical protein V3T17_11340 [Pseudomonadales bacterium]